MPQHDDIVIAFGSSIISPDVYERCAQPGIRLAAEADSEVYALQAAGSISRSYNLILDRAAAHADLEALVLVHEDTEIVDPAFCQKLRLALRDPDVGLVGCVGTLGTRSIAWWEGSSKVGSFIHSYSELGGGEFLAVQSNGTRPGSSVSSGQVDAVAGFMLALSPWVVRNLRFDESLGPHWGYDFDYSLQVRAAGRKVVAADLQVVRHQSLALVSNAEPWIAAHMRAAEKWDGRMPGGLEADTNWKLRARRAEAEAVVARLQGASILLQADARTAQHARRVKAVTDTRSWRLTEPLRRLNSQLRRYRRRQRV